MSPSLGNVEPAVDEPVAPDGSRPGAGRVSPEATLEELRLRQATHPFWDNRLLVACRRGHLTREDLAPVLAQYYLACHASERCLHALLANCEREETRAPLADLLCADGARAPEQRPLELLRRCLRDGLGVEVEALRPQDATRYYMRECLDFCLRGPAAGACAFLALGTESLLARLSSVFVEGLLQAGVAERHLRFFHQHMASDGERARVLEELMLAHADEPGWYGCSLRGLERALELRGAFFDSLFAAVPQRRVGSLLERIQLGEARVPEQPEPGAIHLEGASRREPLFRSTHAWRGIDFTVERVPFEGEVLQAHILRVARGQGGEARQHPHETLLTVLSGSGRVRVNATTVEVGPGHLVFVPRQATCQAHAAEDAELTLLVVTDGGLTRRAHVGEYLEAARQARASDGEG
jgi:quercetin dioxygenase-like cupin family protein/pyrroloquinoline quinone (PQQ) biosynthesis protein C